jgi:hypothetical protein
MTARSTVASAMSEKELQQTIVDTARLLGWMVYHTHDSRRSEPGFPDLVLVHPKRGRLMFVECKSATGRVTPEQTAWLDALALAGQTVKLAFPEVLDDMLAALGAA